tara:strand:- start:732 stop:1367 length:636 start_codon:yes stop_codon:yes gene_type:complete
MKVKSVNGHSVESYSALPKKEREKWGFYIRPNLYTLDLMEMIKEGDDGFTKFYKKNYPIQAFFRETVSDFFLHRKWGIQRRWRKIKSAFVSENASTEDLVPREYMDKVELIPLMILQMTLEFQEEANNSYVDYEYNEDQKNFKKWLDKTCYRIKVVLPYIENRHSKAYDPVDRSKPYKEAYKYVNYWEELGHAVTDRLCKEIIEKRRHFWT